MIMTMMTIVNDENIVLQFSALVEKVEVDLLIYEDGEGCGYFIRYPY